jgi:hypothetical protein
MVFNAMIALEHSANDPNGELAAAETQTQRLHPAGPSKPPGIKKRATTSMLRKRATCAAITAL